MTLWSHSSKDRFVDQIDTSVYNRPQPNPMAGIGQTVGIANAFTENQILNAQSGLLQGNVQGQGQYGQALMDAGGDPTKAFGLYTTRGGNPMYAPAAATSGAALAGQNISNETSLAATRQTQLSEAIGLANAQPTRAGKVAAITQAIWNKRLDPGDGATLLAMPPDDAGASAYMQKLAAGMISTPTQAAPVQAGVNPDLTPKMVTGAKAAAMAQQPGGYAGAAPPGAPEVSAADRKTLFEDQLRGSGILSNMRPLQQALPLIQQLSNANFGPGSPQFATLKGALTTAGIIDPNTSDLQVRQEANKYLLKYAAGAQAAGRSDHALSAALGSNPNLDLTQPANLGLIKTQIGMDRMDAAMPKAFPTQAKPGQTYSDFKSSYYQGMDPRAFSFDIMSPQDRAKLKSSLGPATSPAYQKFVKSYDIAKQTGMLQPQGSTP
jgi:hypothetical protein